MFVVLGHESLFSKKIGLNEIIQIISEYPAFQWLDLFAKIEAFLSLRRNDILDPQEFLAQQFFPQSTLRRVNKDSSDEKTVLFALGPLNILRKLAIAYGRNDIETEIPIPLVNISKIILAAQDFHSEYDKHTHELGNLESFFQFVIRNGYLNTNLDIPNAFIRTWHMYIIESKKLNFSRYDSFADFFTKNVGITTEEAIALSFALSTPLFAKTDTLLKQTTIIDPKTFFENLIIKSKTAYSIIENLTIGFSEIKKKILIELNVDQLSHTPIGYNLDLFTKTPLIKLDNGKLVCANFACLLKKTTQNIIWLPKSRIQNSEKNEINKLVNDLTNYRGLLFQEYIKTLCQLMATKNEKIFFYYIPPESTVDNEEVGDAILIQGDALIILEAKSRQFNETFKYTGDWLKDKQFIEGLVKKASQQIETAVQKIRNKKIPEIDINITKIYPVIITYERIPMHGKIQRFIREKVKEFSYLQEQIFAPIEIIYIGDLENVMPMADSYTLIELLEEKHSYNGHSQETDFNNFLANLIYSNKITSNGWIKEEFNKLHDNIFKPNFKFK